MRNRIHLVLYEQKLMRFVFILRRDISTRKKTEQKEKDQKRRESTELKYTEQR